MPIIVIILILLLLYLITTYIMFIFISKKFKKNPLKNIDNSVEETLKPYQDIIKVGTDWLDKQNKKKKVKDVYIESDDGLILHGLLIENKKAKGIFVETNGYRSTIERDLVPSCYHYYELGYSILLAEQRATGKSEGKYITFGIKESNDLINWCKYINAIYNNKPIVLAGVSMGATSVMMATTNIEEDMNIKYLIADCGFISAYNEVLYCIKHFFNINGKIFMPGINMWCKVVGKFNLKDKNVLKCLKDKKLPLLLIHGEKDDFVPTINSKIIYEEYKGPKKLHIFPDASHGISYLVDSKKYVNAVKKFIE